MLDIVTREELSDFKPITTAFVIVKSSKGYMLLYNKYRHLWELAGGMVEQGEAPRDCAVRECFEESGQRIEIPGFLGLVKFEPGVIKRDSADYCALFAAEITDVGQFEENDEIKALRWWDAKEKIDDLCPVSGEMIEWYIHTIS